MMQPSSILRSLCGALLLSLLVGCTTPGTFKENEAIAAMRFVYDTDEGARISALEAGDPGAQRVIYVHGTPGSATAFARYMHKPVENTLSISIDRPGWGKTRPRRARPAMADQAAALAPLLEAGIHGEKPILVGHSLGGPIIAKAAALYPDRVGAIVIVSGSLDPSLERTLFIQRLGDFLFMPLLLPRWLRNTNKELMPLKRELVALEAELGQVTCPVIIVHGDEDGLVPYSNVDFMVERFTNASALEVVRLEGEDHFIVWTAEDAIREAIQRAGALANGAAVTTP